MASKNVNGIQYGLTQYLCKHFSVDSIGEKELDTAIKNLEDLKQKIKENKTIYLRFKH